MKVTIDFETKSLVDLRKTGLAVYAAHPSTDINCMAFAVDEDEILLWLPGMPFPIDLLIALTDGAEIHAHNAAFEFAIWNQIGIRKYGWPELPLNQVYCNMTMATAMGLPASLEMLAKALNLKVQKDMAGSRVMLQLAKPRKKFANGAVLWWEKTEHPDKYKAMYEYCKQDVEVERASSKYLKPLSPKERQVWLLDQKINLRGIRVDLAAVQLAEKIIESEIARLDGEMFTLTKGEVNTCSSITQLADYLTANGVEADSVDKASVTEMLAQKDLPPHCRKALELRQEAAKSSTAKLKAMQSRASADGRIRNTLQYYAAHTGRWGGRGIQLQNLPRPKLKQHQIDRAFELFKADFAAGRIDMFIGPPMSVISDCIRGFLVGEDLIAADWANIEGRVLCWLAGEEWKIKAFRDFDAGIGPDMYLLSYSTSFFIAIEKVTNDQRQIGKVTELSMGFQGGVGAFQAMAKGYGVVVTDARADEIKVAWRNAHPRIQAYWYAIEDAALKAVRNPGHAFGVRNVAFKSNRDYLMCRLPSGRVLHYPGPKIQEITTPWGAKKDAVTFMTIDDKNRWTREKTYGGKLVENITQAVARDILAEGLINVDAAGHSIVAHVHDEIITEGKGHESELVKIMCKIPSWAAGLPLAATGYKAKRYKK